MVKLEGVDNNSGSNIRHNPDLCTVLIYKIFVVRLHLTVLIAQKAVRTVIHSFTQTAGMKRFIINASRSFTTSTTYFHVCLVYTV